VAQASCNLERLLGLCTIPAHLLFAELVCDDGLCSAGTALGMLWLLMDVPRTTYRCVGRCPRFLLCRGRKLWGSELAGRQLCTHEVWGLWNRAACIRSRPLMGSVQLCMSWRQTGAHDACYCQSPAGACGRRQVQASAHDDAGHVLSWHSLDSGNCCCSTSTSCVQLPLSQVAHGACIAAWPAAFVPAPVLLSNSGVFCSPLLSSKQLQVFARGSYQCVWPGSSTIYTGMHQRFRVA